MAAFVDAGKYFLNLWFGLQREVLRRAAPRMKMADRPPCLDRVLSFRRLDARRDRSHSTRCVATDVGLIVTNQSALGCQTIAAVSFTSSEGSKANLFPCKALAATFMPMDESPGYAV
jgi:hypothetical protein